MSKDDENKKNVVVIGGGFAGYAAAKELGTKIDHTKYNVILITSRPYYVHLIALIRMTVSDADDLESEALIPYDKLVGVNHVVGTAVSIEEAGQGKGGQVVLEVGERVPYAALVLATGSVWSGPLSFGDSDQEIRQALKQWRQRYASARHVVITGGGAVGIGMSPWTFYGLSALNCPPQKP